jgi:hypothetical protein
MRNLNQVEINHITGGDGQASGGGSAPGVTNPEGCIGAIEGGAMWGVTVGALVGAYGGVGGALIGAGLGALIGGAIGTNDSSCSPLPPPPPPPRGVIVI